MGVFEIIKWCRKKGPNKISKSEFYLMNVKLLLTLALERLAGTHPSMRRAAESPT